MKQEICFFLRKAMLHVFKHIKNLLLESDLA